MCSMSQQLGSGLESDQAQAQSQQTQATPLHHDISVDRYVHYHRINGNGMPSGQLQQNSDQQHHQLQQQHQVPPIDPNNNPVAEVNEDLKNSMLGEGAGMPTSMSDAASTSSIIGNMSVGDDSGLHLAPQQQQQQYINTSMCEINMIATNN